MIYINIFPVLKTGDPKGFQSSNLCASARLNKGLPKGNPFVFLHTIYSSPLLSSSPLMNVSEGMEAYCSVLHFI
ncbi:hypothetical protein DO967_19265 [Salmonella enterica subsp. salamae]|nr:hypothetical protein [Salmonella enterica subsp. salamae]ECG1231646.1 hypothetical protein [Salmonella enterica subsp. salamae]ECI3323627.1 hypothetical protein [Salmonella enterica subsp. salamae]